MSNARCYISDDESDEGSQSMPATNEASEGAAELELRRDSSLTHHAYADRFIDSADESSASWRLGKSSIVSESPEVLSDRVGDVITIGNSPYRPSPSDLSAVPGRPSIVLVDAELGEVEDGELAPKDAIITISSTSPVSDDGGHLATLQPSTSLRGPPIISPRMPFSNIGQPGKSGIAGGSKQGACTKQDRLLAKLNEKKQQLQAISGEAISAMHSSIATAPEGIPTATPEGLRTELMNHQKTALTWLLWREKQSPPGGILADDMGLGKTLSLIALILHSKREIGEGIRNEVAEKARSRIVRDTPKMMIRSNATLVVAPTSLVYQWEKEVKDRVKPNQLRVCVFHGPKHQREKTSAVQLAAYDIVITTYNLIATELSDRRSVIGASKSVWSPGRSDSDDCNSPFAKKTKNGKSETHKRFLPKDTESVLTKILWERVVLDEAHQIKNRRSLVSRGCCRIPSVHRWCLTGTPVHNELWDLFSLIRFLQVSPFADEPVWKDLIMNGQKNSAQRLNTLVKGILLRRTKQQLDAVTKKPIIELTVRRLQLVALELQGLEAKCYSIMFEVARQKVKAVLQDADQWGHTTRSHHGGSSKKAGAPIKNPFLQGSRFIHHGGSKFQAMSCILALLLRLRQACVHLALTRNAVDMSAFKDDSAVEGEEDGVASLDRTLANLSLDESALDDPDDKENVRAVFEPTYKSTKIASLLEHLRNVIDSGDKCVIVSQWTSVLEMIEHHLRSSQISYTTINGSVLCRDRQERVDSFNRTNGGVEVLLLSLTAGGVGLNLVGGNHLFMVDPHWNPAIEAQACDRIYRMGQQKDVFIHKFICQKTIEQRVLQLQEKKLALAKSVLEGATAKDLTKLTITDIKWLFELGNTCKDSSNQ